MRERERERERGRGGERETDRQTETERAKERKRERKRDRQTEREREKERQTDRERKREKAREREREREGARAAPAPYAIKPRPTEPRFTQPLRFCSLCSLMDPNGRPVSSWILVWAGPSANRHPTGYWSGQGAADKPGEICTKKVTDQAGSDQTPSDASNIAGLSWLFCTEAGSYSMAHELFVSLNSRLKGLLGPVSLVTKKKRRVV